MTLKHKKKYAVKIDGGYYIDATTGVVLTWTSLRQVSVVVRLLQSQLANADATEVVVVEFVTTEFS